MTNRPTHIRVTMASAVGNGRLTEGKVYPVTGWSADHPLVADDQGRNYGLVVSKWEPAEAPKPTHIRVTSRATPLLTEGKIYQVTGWRPEGPRVTNDSGEEQHTLAATRWEPAEAPEPPVATNPAPSGSVAGSILLEAATIVGGDRNTTHGDKERSFVVIASMWNAYLDGRKTPGPITARDVAACMVLLKLARSVQGTAVRDHFVDAAGYAAIMGELT